MQKTEIDSIDFKNSAHAKCILCGEHSISRGHPALVIPVLSKSFNLTFYSHNNVCTIDHENTPFGETLLIIFSDLLEHSLKLVNKPNSAVGGKFILENNIPMGYGLGFSAAVCVSLTKWMIWKRWVNPSKLFKFSRKLEDFFHGKSSGLDIAGVLTEEPIVYSTNGAIKKINPKWQPYLCLTDTHKSARTSTCIEQVSQLWKENVKLAKSIDSTMENSVLKAQKAFLKNKLEGLIELKKAMAASNDCFQKWGLINSNMHQQMEYLLEKNALAVKPTGSGDGGYILSLWGESPPESCNLKLIRIS